VGAVIEEGRLPLSDDLRGYAHAFNLEILELALSSGEDYGLLLTVPRGRAGDLESQFLDRFGRPIWRIGEATGRAGLSLARCDGTSEPLEPRGWDAFRSH
jgi:thiamine monophosphate kinase